MPKRPHTSDSLDTVASTNSSRWSLQKLHSFIGKKESKNNRKSVPFRLSTEINKVDHLHHHHQQQQQHAQKGDAFWSSHQDFSEALSLQEQAPVIDVTAEQHHLHQAAEYASDREPYTDSAENSEGWSDSPTSDLVSPSWQSPTSTLHMPLFGAAQSMDGKAGSSEGDAIDYAGYQPALDASAMGSDRLSLQDFDVLDTLGTGTFGRVLLVRRRGADPNDRRNYYAMKVLKKSVIVRLKQVEHINSERTILSNTDHPFLVKMVCTFQDSLNCYMLMEFVVGGEIFTHLRRQKRFSVDVTRFYIATLVLAISYLHSKRVVYRDMKPENLLIGQDGYLKIADFGFAKELSDTDRTWTLCGTPEYLSPEVIQSRGQTFACDYWCLGILMYEMLCGHPPFYDTTPFGTYEKILAAKLNFPSHVDSVSRNLISSLLTVDVSKRLGNLKGGSNDVMNHPWFQGVDWRMLLEKKLPAPIRPYQSHPSDSSNFENYGHFDISNMPGLHLGVDADQANLDSDPWKHLFTSF